MANEKRLIDATEARKHSTHDIITHFLDRCPTVDAVPVVHGRWEQRKIIDWLDTKICYRCTECKTHWDANTNYCPNCGAKMDGDGNG